VVYLVVHGTAVKEEANQEVKIRFEEVDQS
jgi:hypothetical protein